MTRNLKALGLAFFAMFALGAVAASAALATPVLTSDGPVTLDGVETGTPGVDNSLTFEGHVVKCPGSTYTGHEYNVTPHEFIEPPVSTVTINPQYNQSECAADEFSATVVTEGCDYVFHTGEKISEGTYSVTADVVCETGKAIYVEAFAGESHGFRVCTDKVPAQTGIEGTAHLTNTPESGGVPDDIDLAGTFEGITVHQSGLCGTASGATGVLHVDLTITGTNESGGATGVTISGS